MVDRIDVPKIVHLCERLTDGTNKQSMEYIYDEMLSTLSDDFDFVSPALCTDSERYLCFQYDVRESVIFRVDDSTANLTEEEMRRFARLVLEADRKELKAFVTHEIFEPLLIDDLPDKANIVDCTWVREWKVKHKEVKSRLCARGCFDRPKNFIEKHSSTATRLSPTTCSQFGLL